MPDAIPIIERLRRAVDDYEPERILIGELADVDSARISDKYTVEGEGLHAVYDFGLVNGPRDVVPLIEHIGYRSEFLRTGWLMNVVTNHDSRRAVSDLTDFAETREDQVAAQKLLFFLQFCLRGGGIVYQGEELALPQPQLEYDDLRDPWGIAFWPDFEGRDGARTPMPWTNGAPTCGFTSGTPWMRVPDRHREMNVARQRDDPGSALAFLREFLAWRRNRPVLKWGEERVHGSDLAPLVLWERWGSNENLLCVANFSTTAQAVPASLVADRRPLSGPGFARDMEDGVFALPPLGFGILSRSTDND